MQSYKKLFTYWYSLIIYDLTVEFCDRWIKSYKLREQMTGAGRSGKHPTRFFDRCTSAYSAVLAVRKSAGQEIL